MGLAGSGASRSGNGSRSVFCTCSSRLADHVPCVAININEHSRGIYRVIGIILVGCRIGVIRIRQVDDGGFADWHDGQAHDIGQVKLADFGRRFEDIESAYLLVARA